MTVLTIDSNNILQPLGWTVYGNPLPPPLKTRDYHESVPGRRGEYDFGRDLDSRTITLRLISPWVNSTTVAAARHLLMSTFNDTDLELTHSDETGIYYGVTLSGQIDVVKYGHNMDATVPLKMCDPYAKSDEHTITTPYAVENVGNVETFPTIEIAGEVINPSVLVGGDQDISAVFTRASTAYKQDGTSVASGEPRYEDAATGFGQAITVERAATNLIPSDYGLLTVDTDTDGVVDGFTKSSYASTCVFALDGGQKITLAALTAANAYGRAELTSAFAVSAGQAYVFSVDSKLAKSASETVEINIQWLTAADVHISFSQLIAQDPGMDYSRLRIAVTAPALAAKAKVSANIRASSVTDTGSAWFRHIMFQVAPETSFHPNTRDAEVLTMLKDGVLSDTEFSIQRRIYLFRDPGTNPQYIFDGAGAVNENVEFYVATSGKLTLVYGTGSAEVTITSSGAAIVKEGWYLVAARGSTAGCSINQDGANVGEDATAPGVSFGASQYWGSDASGANQLDGLMDDARESSKARTDAEFLADHESGEPLPVDQWTTCKMTFDETLDSTIEDAGTTLSWTGTVASGHTLVINCENQTVADGSTNCLADYSGGFPSCPVGNTKVFGTNTTVKWRNRYV